MESYAESAVSSDCDVAKMVSCIPYVQLCIWLWSNTLSPPCPSSECPCAMHCWLMARRDMRMWAVVDSMSYQYQLMCGGLVFLSSGGFFAVATEVWLREVWRELCTETSIQYYTDTGEMSWSKSKLEVDFLKSLLHTRTHTAGSYSLLPVASGTSTHFRTKC